MNKFEYCSLLISKNIPQINSTLINQREAFIEKYTKGEGGGGGGGVFI